MIIGIIVFYLIGCILSYGRVYASFYEIEENYIKWFPPTFPNHVMATIWFTTLLSWFGLVAGIAIYKEDKEKYCFKYSSRDLVIKYKEERAK